MGTGIDLFFSWENGIGVYWDWHLATGKYSELISNFFHLLKHNVDDSLLFLLLHYIDSVTSKQAYAGAWNSGFLLQWRLYIVCKLEPTPPPFLQDPLIYFYHFTHKLSGGARNFPTEGLCSPMARRVKVATLMKMYNIVYNFMIYLFMKCTNQYTKLLIGRSKTTELYHSLVRTLRSTTRSARRRAFETKKFVIQNKN